MEQKRSFQEIAADVRRAQAGDGQAMERILADVQDMVYYNCLRMLRDEQTAQDAAQDILIAVYTKLGKLADPTAYVGWVKRITANQCKNRLSKVNREFLLSENEEGEDPFAAFEDTDEQRIPDKALDNDETRRMINGIVDELPDEQRMCVMLYYYDEMKTREIAQALNISEGTIKSRLNYARKTIRERVKTFEKQGVRFYGLSPIPFLTYYLSETAASVSAPLAVGEIAASAAALTAGLTATAAAATAGTAAATTAAGTTAAVTATGMGAFLATAAGKAIAAVVVLAVIGAAGAGVTQVVRNSEIEETATVRAAESTDGDMALADSARKKHRRTPAATAKSAHTARAGEAAAQGSAPASTPEPAGVPTEAPTATPTPRDPVESVREFTNLPDGEAEYLLGEVGRILTGENELGLTFSSPVTEVWEIHNLQDYMAFRETDEWAEDVPEGELPCYGVRLGDGTVLYVFLGDGLGYHPWEIYRIYVPGLGAYLLKQTYLSGPQWTAWSTEEPPAEAVEVRTARGWRTRYVARAEKEYRGYTSLETAETDADLYIATRRAAFRGEYGLAYEQVFMDTRTTTKRLYEVGWGDVYDGPWEGPAWHQTQMYYWNKWDPDPETDTLLATYACLRERFWVKVALFYSAWTDWQTEGTAPKKTETLEVERATVYSYRMR